MEHNPSLFTRNYSVRALAITNTSLPIVVSALKSILSTIECLKYECKQHVAVQHDIDGLDYDTSFELNLKYGTVPFFETLDPHQRKVFYKKRECIFHACEKAIDMFPHNEMDAEEEDTSISTTLNDTRLWCLINIGVRTHILEDSESVIIDLNRFKGDLWTNLWIYSYVKKQIESELIWQSRKGYLELYEGCPTATGHIADYLFNIYAGMDICTNIGSHDKIWYS